MDQWVDWIHRRVLDYLVYLEDKGIYAFVIRLLWELSSEEFR